MRKIFILPILLLSIILSISVLRAQSAAADCTDWTQVNDDAFGLGSGADGSYNGEESWEVLVFNDQLYLGMEADNTLGARIWRTKAGVAFPSSQADWEEVAADANGYPFGNPDLAQNDHIDSLAEFQGYIYASTANRGSGGQNTAGTRLYRSPTGNPNSWTEAISAAGFGNRSNENLKDMQVFNGWLCGGTWNQSTGAEVWCTPDGITWTQKNTSGFGRSSNIIVWSGYVYDNALYFGVQDNKGNLGRLFRTKDIAGLPSWDEVYTGKPGSGTVNILGELNGYLYISVQSTGGIVILRSPSGDADSWARVNTPGMDRRLQNSLVIVDGATAYNGYLYVGVGNAQSGLELWRTNGILRSNGLASWKRVGSSGLGDPHNLYTELIPFNGFLYAWTTNYVTGQQVRRIYCPPILRCLSAPGAAPGLQKEEK